MTPASLGLSTATCYLLFRDVRPHVSLSGALPPAFASWGILPVLPYGWHLLWREAAQVTSFLAFVLRVRRSTLSAGFRGGEPGSDINLPSPKPCPFGPSHYSSARWSFMTTVQLRVRCLSIDACSQGWPVGVGWYPVFLPLHRLITSRTNGEDAFRSFTEGRKLRPASIAK